MPQEGPGTPKIACAIDLRDGVTDEAIRGVVQLGVYHVLSGGPSIPWRVSQLQPLIDKLKAGGVSLGQPDDRRLRQYDLWAAGTR